jgi:hypothetical protein
MSDIFFEELNIPKPDYNHGIGSGSHGEQTGKMLTEIEKVLLKEKLDLRRWVNQACRWCSLCIPGLEVFAGIWIAGEDARECEIVTSRRIYLAAQGRAERF